MPLDKTLVEIVFAGGVDTKTDAKLVVPTKLTQLENAVLHPSGTVQKRDGFQDLGNSIMGGGSISNPRGLATFRDEVLTVANNTVYSMASTNTQAAKGSLYGLTIGKKPLATGLNSATPNKPNGCAVAGSIALITSYAAGVTVMDLTTYQVLLSTYLPYGIWSRAVTAGGQLVSVSFDAAGPIKLTLIDPATPNTLGATVSVAGCTMVDDSNLDAVVSAYNASHITIAFASTANKLRVVRVDLTGAVIADTGDLAAFVVSSGVSIYDNGTHVFVVGATNAVNTKVMLFDSNTLATTAGPSTFDASVNASAAFGFVPNGTGVDVYYDGNLDIKKASVSATGTVSGIATLIKNYNLLAYPFILNGTTYIPAGERAISSSQRYVGGLFTTTGQLAALIDAGYTRYFPDARGRTHAIAYGSSVLFPVAEFSFSHSGLSLALSTVTQSTGVSSAEANGITLFAAGLPSMYDGRAAYEFSFPQAPVAPVVTDGGAASGSVDAGAYLWRYVYEWQDAAGNIHQSLPSVPTGRTLAFSSSSAGVGCATVRLTSREAANVHIQVVAYRTELNGTTFYRAGQVDNDSTIASVTITDTLADSDLRTHQILYTTGGILENLAPPACTFVASDQKRAYLGGLEDSAAIWFSREFAAQEGPAFNDTLYFRQSASGGNVSGIGFVDDKRVFFKEREIYVVGGAGPNDTGEQNDFTDPPMRVSADVGCSDWRSIVSFPDGVLFKTAKGIYLLNRALQTSYVGAPVEAYNTDSILSAKLIDTLSQVRFLTSSGKVLVYDYFRKGQDGIGQWSVFSNFAGLDAVNWQSKYTWLGSNGHLYQETPGVYTDAGAVISTVVETAWMKGANIQGFARFYELLVLGRYLSPSTLTLSVGYDYQDAYSYSATLSTGTTFGDTTKPLQFRHQLRTQKAEAVRFKLTDTPTGSPYSGFALTGLALNVGIKRGGFKLSVAKKVG